jgi:hypothetical protein
MKIAQELAAADDEAQGKKFKCRAKLMFILGFCTLHALDFGQKFRARILLFVFFYTLVCPALWLVGALMLWHPGHSETSTLNLHAYDTEKNSSQDQQLQDDLRKDEDIWAWRCM